MHNYILQTSQHKDTPQQPKTRVHFYGIIVAMLWLFLSLNMMLSEALAGTRTINSATPQLEGRQIVTNGTVALYNNNYVNNTAPGVSAISFEPANVGEYFSEWSKDTWTLLSVLFAVSGVLLLIIARSPYFDSQDSD